MLAWRLLKCLHSSRERPCMITNRSPIRVIRGLLPEPTNGPSGEIDPNALDLRVKAERVLGHRAPVAWLLVTTKGRRCIEHVEGIDPNHARFDLFRETMRPRD